MSAPKHPSKCAAKAHHKAGEPLCGLCEARVPHGTEGGYGNWGCRCDRCRAAKAKETSAYWARQRSLSVADAEHLLPRKHKGGDAIENLMPACQPCNSSRHDAPLDDYLSRRSASGLLTVFSDVLVGALVLALNASPALADSSPATPSHLRSPR